MTRCSTQGIIIEMQFSVIYILNRFIYRLGDFFHNWYIHGSRNFTHRFVSVLEEIDRTVALKVTLRYFFQPLYKDYTVVGRILGVIFRSGRVLIGFAVYAALTVVFLLIYGVWLVLPPAILFYAAKGL